MVTSLPLAKIAATTANPQTTPFSIAPDNFPICAEPPHATPKKRMINVPRNSAQNSFKKTFFREDISTETHTIKIGYSAFS